MKTVNFYRVEVKYTGDIHDYTLDELHALALAKADRGIDSYDHTETMTDEKAKAIDGKVTLADYLPCNHIAYIEWCYIEE